MIRKWEELPRYLQTEEVRPFYDRLQKKKRSLRVKRGFDFLAATFLLVWFLPIMIGISLAIVVDSKGGVFFRQERITQYGRKFKVIKFRTMVPQASKLGPEVTIPSDRRITKVGRVLRRYRLDELPQLINILFGDMTFVGTRPEVPRYVRKYSKEMRATLLLPAGVTSKASIEFKDETTYMEGATDVEEVYLHQVLPAKMAYNLDSIRNFSLIKELGVLVQTVFLFLK